jgi:hypothetical protein
MLMGVLNFEIGCDGGDQTLDFGYSEYSASVLSTRAPVW